MCIRKKNKSIKTCTAVLYMDVGRLFDILACSREGFLFRFLVSLSVSSSRERQCECVNSCSDPGPASCSSCCGRNDDFDLQGCCAFVNTIKRKKTSVYRKQCPLCVSLYVGESF